MCKNSFLLLEYASSAALKGDVLTFLAKHSAGGLKAAINNPNVPEETKKDTEARLNQMS